MPLVERYNDWATTDQSFHDPHTLQFDHRLEADALELTRLEADGTLVGAQNNLRATCIITQLQSSYGWVDLGAGEWIYDPDAPTVQARPSLGDHFSRTLAPCIEYDRCSVLETLTANLHPLANVTDSKVIGALKALTWPADGSGSIPQTTFETRIPLADQFIVGEDYFSGYHLGDGLVATAGHCLLSYILNNTLSTLKAVFGWSGDVCRKRFASSQIYSIEKVILCDDPGQYHDATDLDDITEWSRKWDNAVFKLQGTVEQFKHLGKVTLASHPPKFGSPVYNAGHPFGTPLKVSWISHVLRHAICNGGDSPFCHKVDPCGKYTTDLDQFPGNSGGPVFSATTGLVIGHTACTQDAVSESTVTAISAWGRDFLSSTPNYKAITSTIHPYLAHRNPLLTLYPKFLRTLSGNPSGGSLFTNTTFICPGDIAPNGVSQPPNTYSAVFNRHKWDSTDVVHRNLTGRIDRVYLFTTPLERIIRETASSIMFTVTFTSSNPSCTTENMFPSALTITLSTPIEQFPLELISPTRSTRRASSSINYTFTNDVSPSAQGLTSTSLSSPLPSPLASWTHVSITISPDYLAPSANAPLTYSLALTFRRPPFPFPIAEHWPPDQASGTDANKGEVLEWPAEDFHFVNNLSGLGREGNMNEGTWTVPIDQMWTNE